MANPEILEAAHQIYESNYAKTADENAARKAVEDYLASKGFSLRGAKAVGQNQRFGNPKDYILPEKAGGGGGDGDIPGGGGSGGSGYNDSLTCTVRFVPLNAATNGSISNPHTEVFEVGEEFSPGNYA